MIMKVSLGFARLISFVFHPLLVGVYMGVYMLFLNPVYFTYMHPTEKIMSMATIVNNNFIFPVVVVLLLKGLGFSKNIYLETQKERIIPYMASIIFFFWTWYVFYNKPDMPQIMKDMLQGIFYASIIGMIFNIYFKISMHAMGVGGALMLMILVLMEGSMMSGLPMIITILVSGLVISSRKLASDHQNGDLAAGFIVGMGSQLLANTLL